MMFMVDAFQHLVFLFQKEKFDELEAALDEEMPNPEVVEYIRDNWIPVAKMWATIGRRFFHEDQVRTVLNVACYETYLQLSSIYAPEEGFNYH